jgi:prepilin-type N-terminal cleavage/methylation domain-containing protein
MENVIAGEAESSSLDADASAVRVRTVAEDGFTLIEVLVAVAVFAAVGGALLFASAGFGRSLRQSAAVQAASTATATTVDALERDGRSSIAIFTPNADVADHANADGHEVDFYTRDASGSASFTAYCFKAAAASCSSGQSVASVALYRYAWGALPQNGGGGATLSGTVAENVQSFSAKTVAASALLDPAQNPTSAAYFSSIGVLHANDVARQTGYPGVLAGNRVTIVTLASAAGPRAIHLLAGSRPTRRQIVVATYTPPPNALSVSAPGGGSSIAFANPLAPAQSITISEPNYGTRSTTPAQVYTVVGTTCADNASAAPTSITPAPDGSGTGALAVQPDVKAQPAPVSCSVVVSDNSAQTQTIAVTIGQTYALTASAPGPGRVGQTGVFTVTERNYPTQPFAIALSGACANPTVLASVQSGGSYVEQVQATYASSGTCAVSATDGYGQVATSSTPVYQGALYVLAVTSGPTPSAIAPGQTAVFSAAATQAHNGVAPGTPASVPVSVTGSSGPCSVAQLGSAQFSVTALGSGTCTVTVAADATAVAGATTQNSPTTVSVTAGGVALSPGAASAGGATATTLALTSTPPTGGTGAGYAVSYLLGAAAQCSGVAFACTVGGLAPATTYTFTPVYSDGSGATVAGAPFSGTTLAAGGGPAPSPTPTAVGSAPSPAPSPASSVVTVAYYDGVYTHVTSAVCSSGFPTKYETTVSHSEIIGAVLAPAPATAVPVNAIVTATNATGCSARATQTTFALQPTSSPYSPQSSAPDATELGQRVVTDLLIYCTGHGGDCPFGFLEYAPGIISDSAMASDLAAVFEKMAALYTNSPSPDNLIYSARYTATSTDGSIWFI